MKNTRYSALAALGIAGTLALAACGSDNNSSGSTGAAGSAGAGASAAANCGNGTLTAEGSTAQGKAMQVAIAAYQAACDNKVTINYNGTGSGAGVKQFIAGQVNWAGSDSTLKTTGDAGATSEVDGAKATCGSDAIGIPLVAGGISMAYNVSGLDSLNLDAATLTKILKGSVTKWNDPAIAATNSGVALPDKDIKVFFRSDESGTTENLSKYLNAKAPTVWTDAPAKAWKGTGEGKKGSGEVAKSVAATDGSIGYMEVSYAKDAKLKSASIDGTAPEGDALSKAVASGKITQAANNDIKVAFDYTSPAAGAYPIPMVTYELACVKYKDSTVGSNVKAWLTFLNSDAAQTAIAPVGYVPLPADLKAATTKAIASIS